MSDGNCATPGRPNRHTAPEPPTPAATPWERWQAANTAHRTSGSHAAGGLSVADLIARVGAPGGSGHRHAAPEPDIETEPAPEPVQPRTWYSVHGLPAAYASEIPNLDRLARPADASEPAALELPELPAPEARRARRARPMLVAARSAAALLAVLSLVLTGGAWQWSASKNKKLNTISALDPDSVDILDPHAQYGDENFLIVGADTRAGANSEVGAGDTEDAGGARSDTIMLVNIPANRQRVVVVSFPRDLAITPLYCQAWNPDTGAYGPLYDEQTGTYGDDMVYTATKLNSTYSFGGPKCLVKEIQKLSGLSINRFMAVDFVGFTKMVDMLGGVEVCSPSPIYDAELGTVLENSGRQRIDSATALNYVRARNVSTEFNGDYGRIKRQQRFLSSLLRSLISTETFFSLSKLNNVVNMFISNTTVDNIKTRDLVTLGQSLQGLAAGHITFVTIPTGVTDENGDEPPRMSDVRALFDAIINDDPLPGENDQNATTVSASTSTTAQPSRPAQPQGDQVVQQVTAAPQDITVQVSNATGESGLAANASDELQQRGFNVMEPNDYPNSLKATTVFFSPGNEQAAATVATAFANAPIQRTTGKGQVVQVVLGPDFRAVSSPAPRGSAVSVQIGRAPTAPTTELPDDLTVTNAADTTCE